METIKKGVKKLILKTLPEQRLRWSVIRNSQCYIFDFVVVYLLLTLYVFHQVYQIKSHFYGITILL